jgi:membrane associated rhomboid family serine protease
MEPSIVTYIWWLAGLPLLRLLLIIIIIFVSQLRTMSVLMEMYKLWRLITSQLVCGSSSELLLGMILLYTFRFFEKAYGSRKFAVTPVTTSNFV